MRAPRSPVGHYAKPVRCVVVILPLHAGKVGTPHVAVNLDRRLECKQQQLFIESALGGAALTTHLQQDQPRLG